MSSGFSENKGLWGSLSLAGSQNLPYVELTLYLPISLRHYSGKHGFLLTIPANISSFYITILPKKSSFYLQNSVG